MILLRGFFLTAIAVLFVACSSNYQGKNIYGADEFVLDSYKIKEGKFSILELEGKEADNLEDSLLAEYEDCLTDGDVLFIKLYQPKNKELSRMIDEISHSIGFQIIDGEITLPDIDPIRVGGLTPQKAREKIEDAYRGYFSDVDIYLSYKNRVIKRVELAGLVSTNSIPVNGRIRLFDVLAQAKVPTDANLFMSYVLRNNEPLAVDLHKLIKEGDMTQNIVMKGGDKIYIAEPSASSLMVMGEVGVEKVIPLPSGRMSLRHALAEAHGIPFTGDKSYIQVIRGNIINPKIYLLSWEHVIHLPNDSLLLMPGDIVYVASKPITEWNRFISQLFPSFTGIEIFKNGFRNVGLFIP